MIGSAAVMPSTAATRSASVAGIGLNEVNGPDAPSCTTHTSRTDRVERAVGLEREARGEARHQQAHREDERGARHRDQEPAPAPLQVAQGRLPHHRSSPLAFPAHPGKVAQAAADSYYAPRCGSGETEKVAVGRRAASSAPAITAPRCTSSSRGRVRISRQMGGRDGRARRSRPGRLLRGDVAARVAAARRRRDRDRRDAAARAQRGLAARALAPRPDVRPRDAPPAERTGAHAQRRAREGARHERDRRPS